MAPRAIRSRGRPGATVARVIWDGENPWAAAQHLHMHLQEHAAGYGAGRRSVIDAARAWLCDTLAASPRPASALREATAQGIGRSTLYATRKAEDITIAKERTARGRRIWILTNRPVEGERELEDGAPLGSSEVQHL